jgi:RNA polymerase sigma factor (sigma-70 family)
MASPDTELLCRYVADHDEAAFAALVHRHIDLVYAAARRQACAPHQAEEVAQAVFTTLARKAPTLRHHPTLVGWLHTTTRFAASEARRAERRRRQRETELLAMNESPTATAPDWESLRPVIDGALGELKPADREVVLLRFFAQQPFAEIGAALSIPENTARMRVERALEKLRAALGRRGIDSSAAALGSVLAAHAAGETAPALLAASTAAAVLTPAGSAATSGPPRSS